MEVVLSLAIGVFGASGVWLILRPRTFQVIIGLSFLSYAVNLFIIAMGRLRNNNAPILRRWRPTSFSASSSPIRAAMCATPKPSKRASPT